MALDLITIGRSSVDLYGAQVGGRLEDMASFEKYIGGSPTNIAAGTARLGLKSALITRVGDEHMGRFIREQLASEGVDVRFVTTDPNRMTALVILGIRDKENFPALFFRENCADMALSEEDIDPEFIAEARALCATGTHLSNPRVESATMKALSIARRRGLRTVLDIDYRPSLWGLAKHSEGESRYVESGMVTAKLQSTLDLFDLIVGTEEEFHIAGGATDTIEALRAVRKISKAVLVCKFGARGAVAFEEEIRTREDGLSGEGFPIEVFNVLGAGDGFMAGLIKGWLDGPNLKTALTYANACGAFAVSRHGCTPSYPSWNELQFFLKRGIKRPDLRHDVELEQIHWSTNRRKSWPVLRAFAFDHRMQFEEMEGATPAKITQFKKLCLRAALHVSGGRDGYGILCDNRSGRDALHAASGSGLWIGRPVESPGSRPLEMEPEVGPDFGQLGEWPLEQVVKCLCFYHPDDSAELKAAQETTVRRLFAAARRRRLEFLLEVILSKAGPVDEQTTARAMEQFYRIDVYPDWWKLEPLGTAEAWRNAAAVLERHDPYVRGIVVLGLDAPEPELADSLGLAAGEPLVKGFAVGRTIFGDAARAWMRGELKDDDAVGQMSDRYRKLCRTWDTAREIQQ